MHFGIQKWMIMFYASYANVMFSRKKKPLYLYDISLQYVQLCAVLDIAWLIVSCWDQC